MTCESAKSVLSTLAGYKPNNKFPLFYINDANDVTASLITLTAAIQGPKHHENHRKPVIGIRRFMKTQNVDYGKFSYLEDIHFTQEDATGVSLKHRL